MPRQTLNLDLEDTRSERYVVTMTPAEKSALYGMAARRNTTIASLLLEAVGVRDPHAARAHGLVPINASALGIDAGQVREWALAEGMEVSPTGRLPKTVIIAYMAANKRHLVALTH